MVARHVVLNHERNTLHKLERSGVFRDRVQTKPIAAFLREELSRNRYFRYHYITRNSIHDLTR